MEYFCHYCHDWFETIYCESHFDNTHNQKGVTFEKLRDRMAVLGGLDVREEPKSTESDAPEKQKNWLFRDEDDLQNGVLVTNNFQHQMRWPYNDSDRNL
jgi:hypothetical protein